MLKNKKLLSVLLAFSVIILICIMFSGCKKSGEAEENKESEGTEQSGAVSGEETSGINISIDEPTDSTVSENGTVDIDLNSKFVKDEGGSIVGRESYYENGAIKQKDVYNSDGALKESTVYNEDGTVFASESVEFDSDGKELQYITTKYTYEDNELKSYNTSFFDKHKWPTREMIYNADGSLSSMIQYEYDERGNVTVKKEFDGQYCLIGMTENEYNDFNRVTKATFKNESLDVIGYELYEYNEDNSISKLSRCNKDGEVTSYILYVYDESGQKTEEQVYVSNGEGGFARSK